MDQRLGEVCCAVRAGGNNVAWRGGRGNRYCADDHHGVRCNRPWIRGWEKFYAHRLSGGNIREQAAHRERGSKGHERRARANAVASITSAATRVNAVASMGVVSSSRGAQV